MVGKNIERGLVLRIAYQPFFSFEPAACWTLSENHKKIKHNFLLKRKVFIPLILESQ